MADEENARGPRREERDASAGWSLETWIVRLRSALKAGSGKDADQDPKPSKDASELP